VLQYFRKNNTLWKVLKFGLFVFLVAAIVIDSDSRKTEVLEKNMSRCYFVHHKSSRGLNGDRDKPELYIMIQSVPRSEHTASVL